MDSSIIYKPSLVGKIFTVKDGDDSLFYIEDHHLSNYFWVYNMSNSSLWGYLKTTVWNMIDKKQWIIASPKT